MDEGERAERADRQAGSWLRTGEGMSSSQRRAALVAALLLIAAGIFTLQGFLPALVWAAIFAIALWPLFARFARRWPRHQRTLLPLVMVAAVLLLFVVPIALIAVPLIGDAQSAIGWIEQARRFGVPAPPILLSLPFGPRLASLWQSELGHPGQLSAVTAHVLQGGVVTTARAIGASTLHRLILLFFMLLTLFFLLRDGDAVASELRTGSRRAFGDAGEHVGRQIILSIRGTVDGLVLVGLAEGVAMGIAYLIVGVPHPTLFGMVTALLAMVPFGAAIAFCAAAALLLAKGSLIAAVVIVVLGAVAVFVADHFVRPFLIGGATRLPFLWVLLGILGGVETWGLLGLFVGPAIMAALILLWREWVGARAGPLAPPLPPP